MSQKLFSLFIILVFGGLAIYFIGNKLGERDLIKVDNPRPNQFSVIISINGRTEDILQP